MPVLDIAAWLAVGERWSRNVYAFCWHSPHPEEGAGRCTRHRCCPHGARCSRRSHHHHTPARAPALLQGVGGIPGHAPALEMELPVPQWLSSPGLSWRTWCQHTGKYPKLSKAACRCGPCFLYSCCSHLGKFLEGERNAFRFRCSHKLFYITYILAVSLIL